MPFGCTPNGILHYLSYQPLATGMNLLLSALNLCYDVTKNIH